MTRISNKEWALSFSLQKQKGSWVILLTILRQRIRVSRWDGEHPRKTANGSRQEETLDGLTWMKTCHQTVPPRETLGLHGLAGELSRARTARINNRPSQFCPQWDKEGDFLFVLEPIETWFQNRELTRKLNRTVAFMAVDAMKPNATLLKGSTPQARRIHLSLESLLQSKEINHYDILHQQDKGQNSWSSW